MLSTPTVHLDPLSNSFTTYQASLLLASLSSQGRSTSRSNLRLSHLTLCNCSLTSVSPELMTSLANLDSFSTSLVEFSPVQLEVMLKALTSPKSQLKALTLPDYYCTRLATKTLLGLRLDHHLNLLLLHLCSNLSVLSSTKR